MNESISINAGEILSLISMIYLRIIFQGYKYLQDPIGMRFLIF